MDVDHMLCEHSGTGLSKLARRTSPIYTDDDISTVQIGDAINIEAPLKS